MFFRIPELPSKEAVAKAESVGLDPKKGITHPISSYLSYQLSPSQFLIFTKSGRAKIITEIPGSMDAASPVSPDKLKTIATKL